MRATRADLATELAEADRQIAIVERTVSELAGDGGSTAATAPAYDLPSVRDTVREIAKTGEVFTLPQVIDAVKATGNDAKYGSVSSILSRMVNEGELRKVAKRGSFVATSDEDKTALYPVTLRQNDEDPAEAGPSHTVDPQEGGDSDGTPVAPDL